MYKRQIQRRFAHFISPGAPSHLESGFATAIIRRDGSFEIARWNEVLNEDRTIVSARQNEFPVVLNGQITPETHQWKKLALVGNEDLLTRSYLAVTRDRKYIVYAYAQFLDPFQIANLLVQLGMWEAMQLDIHAIRAYIDQTPPDSHGDQTFGRLVYADEQGAFTGFNESAPFSSKRAAYRDLFYYVRK